MKRGSSRGAWRRSSVGRCLKGGGAEGKVKRERLSQEKRKKHLAPERKFNVKPAANGVDETNIDVRRYHKTIRLDLSRVHLIVYYTKLMKTSPLNKRLPNTRMLITIKTGQQGKKIV